MRQARRRRLGGTWHTLVVKSSLLTWADIVLGFYSTLQQQILNFIGNNYFFCNNVGSHKLYYLTKKPGSTKIISAATSHQ